MNSSNLFRRLAAGAAFAVIAASSPAIAAPRPADRGPSAMDFVGLTASGSYLAARHAGQQRDPLAAAAFYRAALLRDPKNSDLLNRVFLSYLIGGDVDEAFKYAERIVQIDKSNMYARLAIGAHALKQGKYTAARRNVALAVRGPITDLTSTLLAAWSLAGAGDTKGAVAAIDKLTGPDWYAIFKGLHAGMIYDLAGNKVEAGKRYEAAYKLDSSLLSVVEAWGGWVSRNKSPKEALEIYEAFDKVLPRYPLVTDAIDKLKAGQKLPLTVASAKAGAGEALYGIGSTLGQRGEDLGLVYLQLSLYLSPNQPLALLALADRYESAKNPEMAIKVYERIPESSPLRRKAAIQMATDLDVLDKGDEAEAKLKTIIKQDPKEVDAVLALGNVLRGHKKFAECADEYSKAIDMVGEPTKANWVNFYFRGICYERSKQWPKAEADLKKALELYPDQPQVLNYLGYSWIDRGLNFDQGMVMIKKAVQQRPDDGYIVDSLGWAYFRLGNFPDAVTQLERAIALKPEDPTINDHLGDAYWRVGRKLEARFQWAHARDFKPDAEDLPKILSKIENGLPDETSSQAKAVDKPEKKSGNGG